MSDVEVSALAQMKTIFDNKIANLPVKINSFLIPSKVAFNNLVCEVESAKKKKKNRFKIFDV